MHGRYNHSMSAAELINLLTQIPFVVIGAVTLLAALRRPRLATINIALLFGSFAVIVVHSWFADDLGYQNNTVFQLFQSLILTAAPYLLVRVVSDLIDVPDLVQRVAAGSLGVLGIAMIVTGPPFPSWLVLAIGVYFVSLGVYATSAFVRGARTARGVTARRLYAAATGSAFLWLVILLAVLRALIPGLDGSATEVLSRLAAVGTAVGYFIAFATPRVLRHAWQEPELRAMLGRVATLPRLPDTRRIVAELEHGAAEAIGAPHAAIGLWSAEQDTLRYVIDGREVILPSHVGIIGQVFSRQRPLFVDDAQRADPERAEQYAAYQARAILAAPITAGDQRLGVLSVYAPRPPIFAEDDLQLVQLLADQAAVILESRALIDATTRVQAREEATRLRDEFLVAAAHDLRTPLTALIGRAQLMERRAARNPEAPVDTGELRRISADLSRLNTLITELLDAARIEHGRLLGEREPVDLASLTHSVATRHDWSHHQLSIDAPEPVVGAFDRARVSQLLDNLLENALKYTPHGGQVRVSVEARGADAQLVVSDDGSGIPASDLPHIFERFHRAENARGSHSSGLGLGLYICRGIVEEHGGRIDVASVVDRGTTFTITLPLQPSQVSHDGTGNQPATQSTAARTGGRKHLVAGGQ
jgi:signal transduction histidine kinase